MPLPTDALRLLVLCACTIGFASGTFAKVKTNKLDSTAGLTLHNVSAAPVTFQGKPGLRVTVSDEHKQRMREQSIDQQSQSETLAILEGIEFANGVIEAEVAGEPAADAPEGARGFVGIAFRVQPDMRTYDAFYIRPTNGRAEDQVRRNHSAQYVSHPEWPWFRLRKESPERYESYVDLVPGAWTRIRIEVQGEKARLFVHGQSQPTLIVNDLKTGADTRGRIALWVNPGTVAHFRLLKVENR
jgi:hypothetical protein